MQCCVKFSNQSRSKNGKKLTRTNQFILREQLLGTEKSIYSVYYSHTYSNEMLCENVKALGKQLSEILDFEQTHIHIFNYIDYSG